MDISVIQAQEINTTIGIRYGEDTAPKKMIEFINLACPYCRKWFNESFNLLDKAVKSGKLKRIIKLLDKDKESLQRGNIMHHYVTKTDGQKAIHEIQQIFETQEQWKNLNLSEVEDYAKKQLRLSDQKNKQVTEAIIYEANTANIRFIPTIFLEDKIFDESITNDELMRLIL